jgi:hypothetical protein
MTVYDDDEFDSPQEAIAHYRELLRVLGKRKRALELQKAEYGIAVPAHVRTELENVNEEMQQLRNRIKQLEGGTPPLPVITSSLPRIYPPLPAIYPANDWASAEPGIAQLAVLQMIHNLERESPGTYVTDMQLVHAMQMKLDEVRSCLHVLATNEDIYLEAQDDIVFTSRFKAILTQQGRMRVRS